MSIRYSNELEYLRYIYNSLDTDTLVELYKNFPQVPPQNYLLILCEDCSSGIGEYMCGYCQKDLCEDCMWWCDSADNEFCEEHFQKCVLCDQGCVCTQCRTYTAENVCTVCTDNYELPYFCGCELPTPGTCMICAHEMDPVTKERTEESEME
jgi:hypothetical protein